MRGLLRGCALITTLVIGPAAFAGFEKPVNFGARAEAMGGTAIGYDTTVASVFYNPAHLKHIVDSWMMGVDLLPTIAGLQADLTGATLLNSGTNTTQNSTTQIIPIFNVGSAFRVSDTVIVGIGIYSPAGMSAKYESVGTAATKLAVDFKIIEAAPFVVFELASGFALAVQYRASYATYTQELANSPGGAAANFKHFDFTGTSFTGARVALSHDITPQWHWGLAVRTAMTTTLTGKTTAAGATSSTTLKDVTYPWELAAGLAYVAPEQTFTIAFDAGLRTYSQVKNLNFDNAAIPTDETTFDQTLNFNDSFYARVGAEIRASENIFVRLGGGIITAATNASFDSPILTTPGVGWNLGTGFGYKDKTWALDLSYGVDIGNTTGTFASLLGTTTPRTHNGIAHGLGLSFTYMGT